MDGMTYVEAILRHVNTELLPPDGGPGLAAGDDLLTVGGLSSMQFVRLIGFVEERAALSVPPEDMVLENFGSVALIDAYLARRGAGA